MIRWILIIILAIVLILAVVFVFRSISAPDPVEETINVPVAAVVAANQAPNVVGDSFSTSAGQPVSGNVLSNDTDPQNDVLIVQTVPTNGPATGTLQLSADGGFVYTPNAGYVGVDSFSYQVCDPAPNCAEGIAQITINSADAGGGAGEAAQPVEGDSVAADPASPAQPENTDSAGTGGSAAESTDPAGQPAGSSPEAVPVGGPNNDLPQNLPGQPIVDPMTHVVKQGEWLIQIARCYGTSPETIASQNYIPYPSWIMPEQPLTISGVGSVSDPFYEPCIMFYTVVQGDTLYSIAQTYHVELDMLLKANFGCYGYGYYYHPPVATPYDVYGQGGYGGWYMYPWYGYGPGYGAHSPYIYNGCYMPYTNPVIYVGQELIIPVNLENAGMRPVAVPTN